MRDKIKGKQTEKKKKKRKINKLHFEIAFFSFPRERKKNRDFLQITSSIFSSADLAGGVVKVKATWLRRFVYASKHTLANQCENPIFCLMGCDQKYPNRYVNIHSLNNSVTFRGMSELTVPAGQRICPTVKDRRSGIGLALFVTR